MVDSGMHRLWHLHTEIKAISGTRYSEVLDQTRFDAASELLQDPDIKVTDVALQLGYSDSAHFSRAFKRVAGVNPRVYRQAYSH